MVIFFFLVLLSCDREKGSIFNEVLGKTVRFFSPPKNELRTKNAEIFNVITSAKEEKKEQPKEVDSTLVDTLKEFDEALNWVKVYYSDRGNPDPFLPLIIGGEGEEKLLNVELAILTGIVWVKNKYFAILKEGNRGYVLKEGDPVIDGRVSKITESSVSFLLRKFGEEVKVTLSLKGER